tara:strand:- start:900 stop:1493 length:594 start_codon:yes stop_codon:yes gene_type:complete
MRKLILALVILMFVAPVSGHELKEYTVMVNSSGVYPADIPDDSMKEGDSAWFWMKDSTENATLIVELEKDGLMLQSPVLQYECELNENQTEKLDESCETRFDFTFNQRGAAGHWEITFMKYVNDTLTETISGSVCIQQDIHDETHDEIDDTICEVVESKLSATEPSTQPVLVAATISFMGLMWMFLSMKQNPSSKQH